MLTGRRAFVGTMVLLDTFVQAQMIQAPFQAHASAPASIAGDDPFSWTSCGTIASRPVDCGRFTVPLDYANPNAGNASLFVQRMRAEPEKRRGTMFHNPGGPGVPASRAEYEYLFEGSGGLYDVVSWDLRGLNSSTSGVSCFESQEEWDDFWAGSLWYEGVETDSNLHSGNDLINLYSRLDSEDARIRALFKHCQEKSGDMLKYVGSAASARDVALMADALDGPGSEINYWGESYGSVLGQYIIALFPERLGHVAIGANVYAPIWGTYPSVNMYTSLVTPNTDANLVGFARLCAEAGPSACPLASSSSTVDSVLADIQQALLDLYDPDHDRLPEYLSTSGSLRFELFLMMQVPKYWSRLATYLASTKELVHVWKAGEIPPPPLLANVALERHEIKQWVREGAYSTYWSIICSDGADYPSVRTVDVFDQILLARTSEHSRFLGAMWPTEGGWPCHHWSVKAVERVTDFRAVPKHPVLLLSNVHDPITSIENSWKIMDELLPTESAGLGVRAGFGHASWSMHSTCIVNIVQAYMDDWTLPPKNMIACPYDEQPFPPVVPVEGH